MLKKSLPELEIEYHNISQTGAMRLNEAYSEKYNVPENIRLVAPAVFMAGGYLIKDEISMDRPGKLIADSSASGDQQWYIAGRKQINDSTRRIRARYERINAVFVFLAGFSDGVNPCAFATIIFFISYMLISRKKRSEIFQVSAAFIIGVFAAYFLMGLGLSELVLRLSLIRNFGRLINWIMLAVVFCLMSMSVYDGILCLRGRIEDIKLQLPELFEEKIRSPVRAGAKHYNFVVAAFVTGLVVSVLELACTGQVYLPTIIYMLKTGGGTFHSHMLLTLYDTAFILPLIVIFVLTYLGMKSSTLTGFFRRNVVWVKFGTALLFLIFLLLLISTMN